MLQDLSSSGLGKHLNYIKEEELMNVTKIESSGEPYQPRPKGKWHMYKECDGRERLRA